MFIQDVAGTDRENITLRVTCHRCIGSHESLLRLPLRIHCHTFERERQLRHAVPLIRTVRISAVDAVHQRESRRLLLTLRSPYEALM